ncbi:MAG: hypothetical protein IJR99_16520 [Kiritimatiellae bacterium]|nr:hypothetical protein [Kiritimatiellia bacterium]
MAGVFVVHFDPVKMSAAGVAVGWLAEPDRLAGKTMMDVKVEAGKQLDAYRVCRLLGSGGMGAVYEVEDASGKRFALKLFTVTEKNRAFLAKRFLAEAKLLTTLDHPRLVKVHDAGELDGAPFFTMDLVLNAQGEPETLETARRRGGILVPRYAQLAGGIPAGAGRAASFRSGGPGRGGYRERDLAGRERKTG